MNISKAHSSHKDHVVRFVICGFMWAEGFFTIWTPTAAGGWTLKEFLALAFTTLAPYSNEHAGHPTDCVKRDCNFIPELMKQHKLTLKKLNIDKSRCVLGTENNMKTSMFKDTFFPSHAVCRKSQLTCFSVVPWRILKTVHIGNVY